MAQTTATAQENKRGVKVEPGGNGADGKSAELRQDIIRTIEYRSKAQGAYLRSAQDMLESSYSFLRIGRKYVIDDPADDDPHAFDQEITIGAIPNPDSPLLSRYKVARLVGCRVVFRCRAALDRGVPPVSWRNAQKRFLG